MSRKAQNILIITAIVLLVAAAAAVVLLIVNPFETKKYEHEPEEYVYNEDGTLCSIKYYEKDEYKGQKDFFTDGNKDYVMYYDAVNPDPYATEYTENNPQGKPLMHNQRDKDQKIVLLDEYDYQDDGVTLKKHTQKTYDENDVESAVKFFFAEDGVTVTEKFTYLDGKEQTHETFDEAHPYVPEETTAEN